MAMNRDEIIENIYEAFSGVKLTSGVSLYRARLYDDYITDSAKHNQTTENEEQSWDSIEDVKIEKYYDSLSFLDSSGFVFYLPAFIVYSMRNIDSDFPVGDYVIYQIKQRLLSEVSGYSLEQKIAVKQFLNYCCNNEEIFDAELALETLDYWDYYL